jgi:hypothetical protein
MGSENVVSAGRLTATSGSGSSNNDQDGQQKRQRPTTDPKSLAHIVVHLLVMLTVYGSYRASQGCLSS